jgi:hypothetical protein
MTQDEMMLITAFDQSIDTDDSSIMNKIDKVDVNFTINTKANIVIFEIIDNLDVVKPIEEASWDSKKYFPSKQNYSIDPKDYFDVDFSSTIQFIKDTFNKFDFQITDSSFVRDYTSKDKRKSEKLCLVIGFNEKGTDKMPEDIASNYEKYLKDELKSCPKDLGNIIDVKIDATQFVTGGLCKISGMVSGVFGNSEMCSVAYIWFDGDMEEKTRKKHSEWKKWRTENPEAVKRVQDIWAELNKSESKNKFKKIKKFEEYIIDEAIVVYQGVNYGPVYNWKKIGQGNGQLIFCTVTDEWYDPTQVQDIFNKYVIKCRQKSEDPMYSSSEAITQSNIDWIMQYIEDED